MRFILVALLFACVLRADAFGQEKERLFQSLSYSPSGVEREADLARGIAPAHVRRDLAHLKAYARAVRTYTVDRGLDAVLPEAAAAGLRVSLGLWLGPDKERNAAEIARGLALVAAHGAVIDRVYVGNETLQRKELSAADLAAYIRRVRAAIPDARIQVATAEAWHDWLRNPEVAAASDFIGAHLFPYWDGVPLDAAPAYLAQRYDELRAAFPGKPVVIAETGWPSAGPANGGAVPSPDAQERFARAFLAQARARTYDYNYIEAYDQPWKGASIEGAVGAHWGLFGRRREAKIPLVGE